jgi:hypothetical protein
MTAYFRSRLADFVKADAQWITGTLDAKYAADGYATQFVSQIRAWNLVVPMLQEELTWLVDDDSVAANWSVLIEYPLYRLRKRIDTASFTKGDRRRHRSGFAA